MNPRRAQALGDRQRSLVLRSGQLRASLGLQVRIVDRPLAWADRLLVGWRWVQGHPQWAVGAGLMLVALRPRRAWRWGWRLWWAWRRWQGVLSLLSRRI